VEHRRTTYALLGGGVWLLVLPLCALVGRSHLRLQPNHALGREDVREAALLTLFGVVSTLATLLSGRLADAASPRLLLFVAAVLLSAAAFGSALDSATALYASVAAVAIGGGLRGVVVGPTVARSFGPAHHGALRSSLSTAGIAGSSIGPVLLGLSIDHWGGARPGSWLLACLGVVVASSFLLLGSAIRQRQPSRA